MSEPKVIPLHPDRLSPSSAADSVMIVQLSVGELRRLITEAVREATGLGTEPAGLLDVDGAADFIKQSTTYVYRNWREMGGRKIGKNLRFTRADLQKWIDTKGC
jgi:hypothetical protein